MAVDGQEGLAAQIELAVRGPGAGLFVYVASIYARFHNAAVEHHRGAHGVEFRAYPGSGLDALAGVVLVVVQAGNALHGFGGARLHHFGVCRIAATCQDDALCGVVLHVAAAVLADGARHGAVFLANELHELGAVRDLCALGLDELGELFHVIDACVFAVGVGIGLYHVMALGRDEVVRAACTAIAAVFHVYDGGCRLAQEFGIRINKPFDGCARVLDPGASDGLVVFERSVACPFVDPAAFGKVDALLLLPARVNGANVEVAGCGLAALVDDGEVCAQVGKRCAGDDAAHACAHDQNVDVLGLLDVACGDFGCFAQPIGRLGGPCGSLVRFLLARSLRRAAARKAECSQRACSCGPGKEAATTDAMGRCFAHVQLLDFDSSHAADGCPRSVAPPYGALRGVVTAPLGAFCGRNVNRAFTPHWGELFA